MTAEIIKEIIDIIKMAHFNSLVGLSANDLDVIRQKSKNLSFSEKASLIKSDIVAQGTILYDPASLFQATIRIDDKTSELREKRPLAYIEFSDGINSIVEVIDIFESVRSDATNIGHPVIVFAIQHWQKLIKWGKYRTNKAETNLKNIGNALLTGAKNRKVPKELVFDYKVKDLVFDYKVKDLDNAQQLTYLRVAWNRLSKKNILQTGDLIERVKEIEEFLWKVPAYQNNILLKEPESEFGQYGSAESTISIPSVIDFLKSDGSKFVYDENDVSNNSLRPKWAAFRNAFIEWHFGIEASTVEKYSKKAKKQKTNEVPYTSSSFIGPLPQTSVYQIFFETFTNELVKFCPPIHCSKEMAASHRFAKLVDQTGTK